MAYNHFRPYQSGDIYHVVNVADRKIIVEDHLVLEYSWSMLINNSLAACGGFVKLWPQVYELWYNPPEILKKYPIAICKKALETIEEFFLQDNVSRIQTQLPCDLEGRDHLMRMLGFDYEGTLHKFIYDKDYDIYAKVK